MEIYQKIDSLHRNLDGSLQEFEGGSKLPLRYSDRLPEEINLLLHGCGLFDLKACRLIAVNGPDAGAFLQGLVTSDVQQLAVGQMKSSLICGNKGKIQHHLEISRSRQEEWIVSCDPGEGRAVGTLIDRFHVREDLEFRLLNSEMLRIDLSGPQAESILEKLGYSGKAPEWRFEDDSAFTALFPLGNLPRYVNLVSVNILQNFIGQVLQNKNAGLISLEAFDEIRMLEGVPRAGVDYGPDNFPQEAGLGDHISYKKGCYIGQEPHARMYRRGHPNRLAVWLQIPEDVEVKSGSPLFHNGKEIGKITSLGSIAVENFRRGIAMIRHRLTAERAPLSLAPDTSPVVEQEPLPTAII